MGDTNISWSDKVWNPVVGCTRVSPGCLNHGGTIAQFARSGGGIPLPTPPQQAAAYRNETPSGDPALDGCRELPR